MTPFQKNSLTLKGEIKLILLAILAVATLSVLPEAQASALDKLDASLKLPEEEIDLAQVSLILEEEIYGGIDSAKALTELDRIESTIRNMSDFGDSPLKRMGAILRYLYTPGEWNGYLPYSYDFSDPFGVQNPRSKSIANFVLTKKGNCVSMPILVLILAQRLDTNAKLSLAPLHAFIQYKDQENGITNIETTSGTILNNQRYIEAFEIQAKAIDSDAYLSPLNNKQAVAFMMGELARKYLKSGEVLKARRVAKTMLKYHPKSVNGMLLMGNTYYVELQAKLNDAKYMSTTPTKTKRAELDPIYSANIDWYAKAESMGWQEPSKDFDKNYQASIRKFKKVEN